MNHCVTQYVNHLTKEFSLTARLYKGARLKQVDAHEKSRGFEINRLIFNVDKEVANKIKNNTTDAFIFAGYTRISRLAI